LDQHKNFHLFRRVYLQKQFSDVSRRGGDVSV
jgi:hypothetical protein